MINEEALIAAALTCGLVLLWGSWALIAPAGAIPQVWQVLVPGAALLAAFVLWLER